MRPSSAPFGTSRPSTPYGTSRSMGLRALWDFALYGTSRPLGLRAPWHSAPYGTSLDAGEDAEHLCEQPVHADAHDDERDPEADPVEHPHRYRRLTGAEQLRERRGAAQTPADGHHREQRAEGLHAGAEREVPWHEDGHVDARRDREDEARCRHHPHRVRTREPRVVG